MNRIVFVSVVVALSGVAILLLMDQNTAPATDPASGDPQPQQDPSLLDQAKSMMTNFTIDVNSDTLNDPNVQAFLTLIRTGEGTLGPNGYRTIFGGQLFDSFADHPRVKVTAGSYTSTAAGAYQFLASTWDNMQAKYNLPDFSPASQDLACLGLIKGDGALSDVVAGRFKMAIDKCNKTWASLPGSPYGQPTLTYARAQDVLVQAGATLDGAFA